MDKAEVLDRLLSRTCPKFTDEDGTNVFLFDLCCREVVIHAKVVGKVTTSDGEYLYSTYEITHESYSH
jgi:hypothetical protein